MRPSLESIEVLRPRRLKEALKLLADVMAVFKNA